MGEGPKPKRRVRYKGTHPKRFEQKYKELDPQKYKDDLEKVKSRGQTPVGTHRPICVDEILEVLKPKPGDSALDATLGYGGHASEILKRIIPGGKLIGVDQDPIERKKTEGRLREFLKNENAPESSLLIAPINFRESKRYLHVKGIKQVDLILADLGISSMQLDDPARGFSYKLRSPLDLRMNPQSGVSAAEWIAKASERELAGILRDYSDEGYAGSIAQALIKKKPKTTEEMTKTIEGVILSWPSHVQKEQADAPIRRAFQALRIAVNDEFGALDEFLEDLPMMLKPGGRAAILSFHSGEDRRVKKSFQQFHRSGIYKDVSPEFIRPSMSEQRANPRSKSAKLRWAIRSNS